MKRLLCRLGWHTFVYEDYYEHYHGRICATCRKAEGATLRFFVHGPGWFRLWSVGPGIGWTLASDKPLFEERYGYTKTLTIGVSTRSSGVV